MPGSAQWRMLTFWTESCWICDLEIKGFIFWHPSMAGNPNSWMFITDQEKSNIYEELERPQAVRQMVEVIPEPTPPQEGEEEIKEDLEGEQEEEEV